MGDGEMAREYRVRKRARDAGDERTKKEEKKRETKKERKEREHEVPFEGPSASERLVISFYIHPARFEPLLFHFRPSYLSLTALTPRARNCATEFLRRRRSETKFSAPVKMICSRVFLPTDRRLNCPRLS